MSGQVGSPAGISTHAEQTYTYFAFISYSRKDKKWAERVQRDLERYRMPAALRKELPQLPKSLRPVFRDMTDLSAGPLQDELQRKLDASKKLIVICSPHAAASEWVNKEIERFIDTGRKGEIIPFIVDGAPGGGMECFPEALRLPDEEQLLGVSVAESGWRDALLRLAAGLMDIEYDQLKRRHQQRQKRRNAAIASLSVLFLILSAFAGYYAWDYYVPHDAYYADYVMRWGAPEGLRPLTKQEIAGRAAHYRMTTERGKVRRLAYENAAGTPIAHANNELLDRQTISVFYYRDSGQVEFVEYMDLSGRVLAAKAYTTELLAADFQVSAEDSSMKTLAASTIGREADVFGSYSYDPFTEKSSIARHEYTYDENGSVTQTVYMRDRRTPVTDADGIGGIEYILDEKGRTKEVRYLWLNGDAYFVTKRNIAGKRYRYDDDGNMIRIEYFDPQGEPVFNEAGWMICELAYEGNGNCVEASFLDADGKAAPLNDGYAAVRYEYDQRGNRIKSAFFNAQGEPVLTSQGFSAISYTYDERGFRVVHRFIGIDGEPILLESGYAAVHSQYDESGNHISEAYTGLEQEPVLTRDGYASLRCAYDSRGRRVSEACFGIDGQPVLTALGFAEKRFTYDGRGNRDSEAYFGVNGESVPIEKADGGYARITAAYDERGQCVRTAYFSVDGKPVLTGGGYASIAYEYTYDLRGNGVRGTFLGLDGEPVLNRDGYAVFRTEYDARGNIIMQAYFDKEGALALLADGYAGVGYEYDIPGNLTWIGFFDEYGEPVCVDGYAEVDITYDVFGNVIKETYFDENGNFLEEIYPGN